MSGGRVLVTGAGGFLGSHVVRRLVQRGRPVRAFVRRSTNVEGIAGLDVEWAHGDITDRAAVDAAVAGSESIIHCVVNTRAWARDTGPMERTNIDGLVNAMEAALAHDVRRFVLTSSIATIGLNPAGISTEADDFDWPERAGPYINCRVRAERRFFDYVRSRGLPGIAMNVANTFGAGDYGGTPHGRILAAAAAGRLPFVIDAGMACVGIADAAEAMLLAEEKGRVGERYIVSDRWMSQAELYGLAAEAGGHPGRLRTLPLPLLYTIGWIADRIARLRGRDSQLSVESVRLSHIMNDMDASKARTELGWHPRPIEQSVREAVAFYRAREGESARS